MKVRRASDDADLICDDVGALSSFGLGTTLHCDTLYDQTGGGNHMIQTTDANQPTVLIETGDVIALDYNNGNDTRLVAASLAPSTASDWEFLIVGKHQSHGVTSMYMNTGNADAANGYFYQGKRGGLVRLQQGYENDAATAADGFPDINYGTGNNLVILGRYNSAGTFQNRAYNEAFQSTTAWSGTTTLNRTAIGALKSLVLDRPAHREMYINALIQPTLSTQEWSTIGARLAAQFSASVMS
jgi:hypothetical protein